MSIFPNFRISNFQVPNLKMSNKWTHTTNKLGTHTFHEIKKIRFPDTNIIFITDVPIFSCISWSIFVINTGSECPYLVTFLGDPKNLKSMAIDQASLINHFWNNLIPPKNIITLKIRKTNNSIFCFAVFGALLDFVFGAFVDDIWP